MSQGHHHPGRCSEALGATEVEVPPCSSLVRTVELAGTAIHRAAVGLGSLRLTGNFQKMLVGIQFGFGPD